MRLANKLAVITAAASGMGKAGVELFAREGARVAAVDVNAAALAALAAEMAAKGTPIETIQADLSSVDGARGSVHAAADKLGGIDILWAHAGIPGPAGIENLDLDAYRKAMTLNVDSAVFAAGEVVGHMRRRGGGSVIFTASVSGIVGSRFSPVYSAAKFAVVGLTKSLAQTFAPDKVRVNVVCPGVTDTPMLLEFMSRDRDPVKAAASQAKFLESVPLRRLCRPEEIAHAALWLASDDASYVTGIELLVDGGFTCQ
ncbi:SDR family oxidoreductase [uncultured Bradyrhizobium sp.]|uniref:SDR family NAD(P)-dependent oxidoreductase n=1 Tax=Bradyrhizobium sp. TaxID=376 RepID=UPI00261BBCB5|nr:SDR family oxidoreductase [uncultured Bradyrhizobium sp.]